MRWLIRAKGLPGWVWVAGGGICLVSIVIALALTYQPTIAPILRPAPSRFALARVERGRALAAIGDCIVCHTAERGRPFAGGLPMPTPFGILYSTNITPDEKTGIGNWSESAFLRAMRDGVSRDGHHLYPALPYEHFTHVADDDLDALYSYLMTRQPVVSRTPSNRLYFPLGFRPLLAGWKWLFLYHGVFKPQTSQTAAWNRGAYLVEGLGHCGACHTPRNLAGGEERAHAYEGGVAEGWTAPAFRREGANASSWTEASLYTYLRTGTAPTHGVAGGPMGPVVHSLSGVSDSDVKAMATYIAWLMGGKSPSPKSVSPSNTDLYAAATQSQGALIFEGACAGCHEPGAPMMIQGRPSLAFVSSIQADDPNNAVQAILHGIQSPLETDVPYMPPFAETFTDKQIAQVAGYLRARFTAKPAWPKLDHAVTVARRASAS